MTQYFPKMEATRQVISILESKNKAIVITDNMCEKTRKALLIQKLDLQLKQSVLLRKISK